MLLRLLPQVPARTPGCSQLALALTLTLSLSLSLTLTLSLTRYVNSAWNQAIEECMTTKSGLLMLSQP